MLRTEIVLEDAMTRIAHKYEGVKLEYLFSGAGLRFGSETIEVSYGHHQKMTILDSAIASDSQTLVADTIDGKRLTGYVPYFLIIQSRAGQRFTQPLKDVKLISVTVSAQ
jgi:hypothetical protein